jgi:hypothetical protein
MHQEFQQFVYHFKAQDFIPFWNNEKKNISLHRNFHYSFKATMEITIQMWHVWKRVEKQKNLCRKPKNLRKGDNYGDLEAYGGIILK